MSPPTMDCATLPRPLHRPFSSIASPRRAAGRWSINAKAEVECRHACQSAPESSRRVVLSSVVAASTVALLDLNRVPDACAAGPGSLARFLQSRQEKYVLAPIGVGKRKLAEAAKLLSEASTEETRSAALKLIRTSSFNCYVYEEGLLDSLESKASLIQQGFPAIVDPCTYRLIAKNVTKLVPSKDTELVQETNASLEQLLRSYHLLDEALERSEDGDAAMRTKVFERMTTLQTNLGRFEASIRACLRMEANEA